MHPINPRAIYVTEEVIDDGVCMERMQRMLAAIDRRDFVRIDDTELNRLTLANGWHDPRLKGEIQNEPEQPILFTTLKWSSEDERKRRLERFPALSEAGFPKNRLGGYMGFDWRGAAIPAPERRICQPAYVLHTISGCPFMCDYCASLSEVIVIGLNMEEFVEEMDDWLELCPDQTLFKWDNGTDAPCFEPEYGGTKLLIDYFADRTDNKYLLLYFGKCADVDYLLELDHRGHTIVAFSLGAQTQSTLIERDTAPISERIEALKKCQDSGYIPRVRFSPIIPVKNWREENRNMIRHLLADIQPDIISLCMFGWMDVYKAKRALDTSLWDQRFVAMMDMAAAEMRGKSYGPLPHEARAEIFRFFIDEIRAISDRPLISLCLESYEIWEQFGPELGMRANRYLCNCGPQCTPGTHLYRELVGAEPRNSETSGDE